MEKKDDLFQTIAAITRGGFNPPPVFPEFIKNIDWKLLREQKVTLVGLRAVFISATTLRPKLSKTDRAVYEEAIPALSGIIHLIDALQDFAVDVMGLTDKEVFNLPEEE
jgi:hypothetical protein